MSGFFADYGSDPALRLVSLEAQGLWVRMLCQMAQAKPRGHLVIKRSPMAYDLLAKLVGVRRPKVKRLVAELEAAGVFHRGPDGTIICRQLAANAGGRVLDVGAAEWRKLRAFVLARDNYTCRYCGTTEGPLACDHVVPVARGGASKPENLVAACKPCNASKGARSLTDWMGSRQG